MDIIARKDGNTVLVWEVKPLSYYGVSNNSLGQLQRYITALKALGYKAMAGHGFPSVPFTASNGITYQILSGQIVPGIGDARGMIFYHEIGMPVKMPEKRKSFVDEKDMEELEQKAHYWWLTPIPAPQYRAPNTGDNSFWSNAAHEVEKFWNWLTGKK
ncbi:hypothetical protein LJC20_06290 [Eubacteriales bacterium OttesenSCG-928-M02]|nr:hypothetical protein [Eubacteriales bacterium OttesenSCG-928-M02]